MVILLRATFSILPIWLFILGGVLIGISLYLYLDDKGYLRKAKKCIAYLEENNLLDEACAELVNALDDNENIPIVFSNKYIFVKGAGSALRYEDIEELLNYKEAFANHMLYSWQNAFDCIAVKACGKKFYLTGEGTPYAEFPQIISELKLKRADLF